MTIEIEKSHLEWCIHELELQLGVHQVELDAMGIDRNDYASTWSDMPQYAICLALIDQVWLYFQHDIHVNRRLTQAIDAYDWPEGVWLEYQDNIASLTVCIVNLALDSPYTDLVVKVDNWLSNNFSDGGN